MRISAPPRGQAAGDAPSGVRQERHVRGEPLTEHLREAAADEHAVDRGVHADGGGAGRPSKRYRATEPEMNLEINVGHDDVLDPLAVDADARLARGRRRAAAV